MVGPPLTREQAHAMRQRSVVKDKLIMEPHIAIMLDLETMGKQQDCVIAAIAAARCDLAAPEFVLLGEPFYDVVDLNNQPGRRFEPETVRWWLQQNDTARQIFSKQINPTPLSNVLIRLSQYLKTNSFVTVWSKGADFDITILNHAYAKRKLNFYQPWDYRQQQCFRTIVNLHDPNKTVEPAWPAENKHNAMHDAVHQLHWLYNIWQREGGFTIKTS